MPPVPPPQPVKSLAPERPAPVKRPDDELVNQHAKQMRDKLQQLNDVAQSPEHKKLAQEMLKRLPQEGFAQMSGQDVLATRDFLYHMGLDVAKLEKDIKTHKPVAKPSATASPAPASLSKILQEAMADKALITAKNLHDLAQNAISDLAEHDTCDMAGTLKGYLATSLQARQEAKAAETLLKTDLSKVKKPTLDRALAELKGLYTLQAEISPRMEKLMQVRDPDSKIAKLREKLANFVEFTEREPFAERSSNYSLTLRELEAEVAHAKTRMQDHSPLAEPSWPKQGDKQARLNLLAVLRDSTDPLAAIEKAFKELT